MANFWRRDEQDEWKVNALGAGVLLREGTIELEEPGQGEETTSACAIAPAGNDWVVRVGRDAPLVTVNGREVALGICVLGDRDEIVTHGQRLRRFYFSTEVRPSVQPFRGVESGTGRCPRCTDFIQDNDLAVCCPQCGLWHHETDELGCWSYAETCAGCHQQATELDGEFRFHPDDL